METTDTGYVAVSKYRFGAPVLTDDGEEGTLDALIVDAAAHIVSGIRVRFGFLGRTMYMAPVSTVRHATPGRIELHLTRDDLKSDYTKASPVVLLSTSTQVMAGHKSLGKLLQVTVNRETHALRHLVLERGLRSEALIAARNITAVEGRRIVLGASANDAPPLTPYRPDDEIHTEVRSAIYDYPRLRIDLPGIGIHVIDGVLWLQGHVASDLNKRMVQDQLGNIRGLSEIHNELISDTDLANAVAMALAKDSRTARERIGVYPILGNINLRGRVRTDAARTAAYEVARATPGVETVENALIVDPSAEVIPVMAGVTNEEDRVPGGN